jgi:hypothetical protein
MMTELKDFFELANVLLVPILFYVMKTEKRLNKLEIIQELLLNRKRHYDAVRDPEEEDSYDVRA